MEVMRILEDRPTHQIYGLMGNINITTNNSNYSIVREFKFSKTVKEFLNSSLIKGCGEKTAQKIVDLYGLDAIKKIKEDEHALDNIGLTSLKKQAIRESILKYSAADDSLLKLKEMGFSINEATKIYKKYQESTKYIIESNLYIITEIIDFNKVDNIYRKYHDDLDPIRIKACLIESLRRLSFNMGNTYYLRDGIYEALHIR